ncbi:MAG: hypothetical protein AB7F98_08375 [Novosphingobium sp.]
MTRQPRRRGRKIALVIALVAVALLAWYWQPLHAYARAGTSYGAHVACSCRHIGGRSLDACRKDFELGMGLVSLSEDKQAKSVTARYLLVSRQTATFHPGQGCILEKWED